MIMLFEEIFVLKHFFCIYFAFESVTYKSMVFKREFEWNLDYK